MQVNITVDAKQTLDGLNTLERTLLPKATANAINTVMLTAQEKQIQAMKEAFTIRRESYLKRNVKISKFAKAGDISGRMEIAGPGGTTSVFEAFENGGSKQAKNGGLKAIPTATVRPDITQVIPAGRRPRNLKGAFKVGNKIFQEKGKGKNARIQLAYVLKPSVRINNRLHFVDRVTKIIVDSWDSTMRSELDKAIAQAGLS